MTSATHPPPTNDELESEVMDLEAELDSVRQELAARRARSGGVQLAAFFAVLLGIASLLAVAFKLDDNQNSASNARLSMHKQMSGSMPAAMGSGGAATAGTAATAGPVEKVTAQLGDYWVRPNMTSVPAGKVEFVARNVGKVPHELMVERMPIKMDAPGQPNEEAAQGMIEDMGPGESGQMTMDLQPGRYVLFCNVPGHYALGQHTMFTVTG